MKRTTQEIEQGSRWPLYHGTSSLRLERILDENRLRVSKTEPQKVSLTTERLAAEMFAIRTAIADLQEYPNCINYPVLISWTVNASPSNMDWRSTVRSTLTLCGPSDAGKISPISTRCWSRQARSPRIDGGPTRGVE